MVANTVEVLKAARERDTFPADILRTAENALDNLLCNCSESCGGTEGMRMASINDIAIAILFERERCAGIAAREGYDFKENGFPDQAFGCFQVRREIHRVAA